MDAVVKILGVNVRGTRTGQVYDVLCSDGITRQIWDGGLATKANSFADSNGQGADVTIRYDVKQNFKNGKTYTNYSIQAVFGPGEAVVPETGGMASGLGSGTPMGQPMQTGVALGSGTQPMGQASRAPRDNFPPEVTTRITKLAAFEYATTLVGGLMAGAGPEAFEEALGLVKKAAETFYVAARSHEKGGTTTTGTGPITPVAADPAGIAGFVNAEQPGAVQVGAAVAGAQDAAAEAPDVIAWD